MSIVRRCDQCKADIVPGAAYYRVERCLQGQEIEVDCCCPGCVEDWLGQFWRPEKGAPDA